MIKNARKLRYRFTVVRNVVHAKCEGMPEKLRKTSHDHTSPLTGEAYGEIRFYSTAHPSLLMTGIWLPGTDHSLDSKISTLDFPDSESAKLWVRKAKASIAALNKKWFGSKREGSEVMTGHELGQQPAFPHTGLPANSGLTKRECAAIKIAALEEIGDDMNETSQKQELKAKNESAAAEALAACAEYEATIRHWLDEGKLTVEQGQEWALLSPRSGSRFIAIAKAAKELYDAMVAYEKTR
jgi:hypothetical protein